VLFLTGTVKNITSEYFAKEHIPYKT